MDTNQTSKEINTDNMNSNRGPGIPITIRNTDMTPREEKICLSYTKLKARYEYKVKENKQLKQNLENCINATKTFEDTYKSIQSIYNQVKDIVSNFKMPTSNQDFSTSDLSHNRQTNYKAPEMSLMTNNPNNNVYLLKRLEEFDIYYNEMSKNFNNLVIKYKMLKDEKAKIEDTNAKLLSSYSHLEKKYEVTMNELYLGYDEIKRFKEIDKCLVDYTLNSFMLKADQKDLGKRGANNILDPPGIKCEPLPTFAKFLANKK
jgi:hypothetical protein